MNIFKKIINREIESNIVYEDDLVIAFLDISQVTKGHTLVVPKKAYENIFELDDEIAGSLYQVVVKLSKAIKKALNPAGLNIVNNNGEIAGQSVFHYHIHIIPRYLDDNFTINWKNNSSNYTNDDLTTLKESIIKAQ